MKYYEGYCQYIEAQKCDKCQKEAYISLYETDTEQRNRVTEHKVCIDCLDSLGRKDVYVQ